MFVLKKNQNNLGFTFIELMVSIAIIAIISAISFTYIKGDDFDDVELVTEQLIADIRYIRNLAISRTVYDFDGTGPEKAKYPPGGYGLYITNPVSGAANQYLLFADSGENVGYQSDQDGKLTSVTLENVAINLYDPNNIDQPNYYFTLLSENEIATDMQMNTRNQYELFIEYPSLHYTQTGYRGLLILGESSENNKYTWANLGSYYFTYAIDAPTPPPTDPTFVF